jgi:hypothetical protein
MAFPLTYCGKLDFELQGAPKDTVDRFYEAAAYKIERSLAMDAAVDFTTSDNKLIVSYTVYFNKILLIISLFVTVILGIYFSTWDWATPPGLPLKGNPSGIRVPITITQVLSVMGVFLVWFFSCTYVIIVARFRSLLKDTWKELRLP